MYNQESGKFNNIRKLKVIENKNEQNIAKYVRNRVKNISSRISMFGLAE
jgi:hypothetical protein